MSVAFFERVLKHHRLWLAESEFGFTYDPKRERTVVMVEPRRHPMLRAVVDNVMSVIGEGWNFHIYTASRNAEWLRETLPPDRYGYKISWLSLDNLTREQYSQLLMEESFWASIDTEHVLVIQTDVIVFREWNPLFEIYDYVGANYYHPDDVFPEGYRGMEVGGIQGGLSYRRRSAMKACLRQVTEDDVNAYREAHHRMPLEKPMVEDVYFTHATAMLGMRLPPVPLRSVFAIEAEYYATPFGFHGWNRPYFDEERSRELVWASKALRRWALI
jgi:hypothetical protein